MIFLLFVFCFSISQPSATSVLLDSIRNRLSRSGFRFDWSYVEILSGMDEAQFSWVTVNTQLMNVGPEHRMVYLRKGSQGFTSLFSVKPLI
jgi:hypothetical protein